MRLLSSLSVLLPGVLAAQASAADKAIDRAVAAYSSVKTARATFEQSITNALTGSAIPSKGEFEQSRPDRFAFRFTDPKGDVIISDGKFVWLYLPSSTPGQVIRAPLTADLEGSMDLIGAFFTNPRSKYTISDAGEASIGGKATRAVNLTPKGDAAFTKAKVWIDGDGMLQQFEAQENNGVTRRVRIVAYERNAPVESSAFSFKPPKGVKIVDSNNLR